METRHRRFQDQDQDQDRNCMNTRKETTLYPNTYRIPAAQDLKKCQVMSRAATFPKEINQHVDSLVFIIPHRDAHAREAFEALWDTYLQRLCSYDYKDYRPGRFARLEIYARDATVFEAIKRDGLTVNGTRHMPITPTPPTVNVWKINFRYIPYYYNARSILNDFGRYGTVMEMGMYYMDSHRGRHFTQDGYVLYKAHSREERQDMGFLALPEQIEVGRDRKPIVVDVAGMHHKVRRRKEVRRFSHVPVIEWVLRQLFWIAIVGVLWDLYSSFLVES